MLILILETSTEKGCIALANKETLLAAKSLEGGPELSKNLAMHVKNLLGDQKLDLIAVGSGPGSYTGIRVGAALAKALSYGWKIPLVGFCSLEAFGPAPVLVDARSGGFYALLGNEPELLSPQDQRLQMLKEIRSPHPKQIEKRLLSPALFIETNPDPSRLAKLVWTHFLERGITPLELVYLSHP